MSKVFNFVIERMPQFSVEERKWLVESYIAGTTINDLRRLFQQRFARDAPVKSSIYKILAKFRDNGTLWNLNKEYSGRRRTLRTPQNEVSVLNFFQNNPTSSVRRSAQALGIPKTSVHEILKDIDQFAYKYQPEEELRGNSKQRRVHFARRFLDDWVPSLGNIYFTDESYFTLSGHVNKQNDRHWAQKRNHPHPTVEKKMFPEKVMVWAAVNSQAIIISVVENGNINTQRYIELLQNDFLPRIQERIDTAIFMQDGARAHTSNVTLRFLRDHFVDRVISNRYKQNYHILFVY